MKSSGIAWDKSSTCEGDSNVSDLSDVSLE
jgi:hypothetical protein